MSTNDREPMGYGGNISGARPIVETKNLKLQSGVVGMVPLAARQKISPGVLAGHNQQLQANAEVDSQQESESGSTNPREHPKVDPIRDLSNYEQTGATLPTYHQGEIMKSGRALKTSKQLYEGWKNDFQGDLHAKQ